MHLEYDVDHLLPRFRSTWKGSAGSLIKLTGIGHQDGYNPSAPISNGAHPHVYARVEPRADEFSSWAVPFRQRSQDRWEIEKDLPMYRLQDPFTTQIDGTLVVGGVRIESKTRDRVVFRTVLLRGQAPDDLQEFARSPLYMKDVRLVELNKGGVGVFTRPLGGAAGRGRIGYTEVSSLEQLSTDVMKDAPLLETQTVPEQWWGPNQIYQLGGDLLGILAHIARFDGATRHYYPLVFVFDRRQRAIVHGPEIIAERSCFPPGPAKREDLHDVVFPSWLDREKGMLVGGLSDTTIGMLEVGDPFAQWL